MDKSNKLDTVNKRAIESLTRKLGPIFLDALYEKETVDIMLNPDGNLWVEKFDGNRSIIDSISKNTALAIVEMIAAYHGMVVTTENPELECEFPIDNSRFSGTIPPVTDAASFSIRKKASKVFPLDSYVEKGTLTEHHYKKIKEAVAKQKNIVIVGGTNSGKTTLTNAIINEMVEFNKNTRFYIIEDTRELQCSAANKVSTNTTPNMTITDLVRKALRSNVDKIIIGELRGAESLDLLDAWNTGHSGGVVTIHANSAFEGLDRLRSLVSRNPFKPDDIERVIGSTIDLIIFINAGRDGLRRVETILEIHEYKNNQYITTEV